jgi:hypothetical protein
MAQLISQDYLPDHIYCKLKPMTLSSDWYSLKIDRIFEAKSGSLPGLSSFIGLPDASISSFVVVESGLQVL